MKEDCYFYYEEHMMEGRVPCCSFDKYALGICPCNKCTNYIPQSEVYKMVKSKVSNRCQTGGEKRVKE